MKISKKNALAIWEKMFGNKEYAEDFDGRFMYKNAYGDRNFFVYDNGVKIYCGWNLHHVLPKSCGGMDDAENLICTNIITNELAKDKVTYLIGDSLYQVRKIKGARIYRIVKIK